MNRSQFEHVVRAAAAIVEDHDLVVIGSQAILGSHADPPVGLLQSVEVDLYPMHRPERADLIDGAIGEGSLFFETFGYYAHGVGPETAVAPAGWPARLVRFRTRAMGGATAWCLDPHDLVLAKAVRFEPKDLQYLDVALEAGLVTADILRRRLPELPADPRLRDMIARRIDAADG